MPVNVGVPTTLDLELMLHDRLAHWTERGIVDLQQSSLIRSEQ
jgi:hypothetical protein